MQMITFLLSLFHGGSQAGFYPFEECIIEGLQAHLTDRSASQLAQQVAAINKVQRLMDGKEVNLYQMVSGKSHFNDSLRFPYMTDESLLATIILIEPRRPLQLKVNIWLAKGRIFSLIFDKIPKEFFAGRDLKTIKIEIVDVKVWFDPMSPPIGSSSRLTGKILLGEPLQRWNAKGLVRDLHPPLSESERTVYLDRLDAQLPLDYLELISQTNGAKVATCTIYEVTQIRQIAWPDVNYYGIAEIEGLGALAVKEGNRDRELYLLRYEESDARRVGASLYPAVSDILRLNFD
jgi:hypothetical protein